MRKETAMFDEIQEKLKGLQNKAIEIRGYL